MGITTDRNDPGLRKINRDGMQESYLVLSDDERAKGFVRPVRDSYTHVKCGIVTMMGRSIAETYARNNKFYGATFCCECGRHFPLVIIETRPNVDPKTGQQLLGGAKQVEVPQFLWDDGSAVGS